jgi:hypothetical protein
MGMGALVSMTFVGLVFADIKVVDQTGHGDYTTIQAAVNDLPDPGPRTILLKAGTYNETVQIYNKNTGASDDSQRIVIMADPAAAAGSVIVKPPAGSSGVRLERSEFITLRGLVITGVKGNAVPAIRLIGGSPGNEDVTVIACQIYGNASQGIQIEGNNPRIWIMNNLIRDNGTGGKGGAGVTIAVGAGAPVYVVNNTIFRNKFEGVFVQPPRPVYLVNNLIVSNGKYGFQRAKGSSDPTMMTLLYNMFYANTTGDIANVSQTLDATDSGNRTTTGDEGVGVMVDCAFPNCGNTTALTALFVSPTTAVPNLHLSTTSPAIDRGVNAFTDGVSTWQIVDDLEGTQRPLDGDGNCFVIADVGCYEVPTVPCLAVIVPPLDRLLLSDGSVLLSNVNANTLGGVPASGYATIGVLETARQNAIATNKVAAASYADSSGLATNALNLGGIPSSGYLKVGDVIGGTNLWLLNGGTALTNDALEIVTAGGLTGVLSNYGARVQLTLSNTTSVGTVTYAESSGYATNAT